MKVLLVEDHADVAKSTVMLLELLNHEVRHAKTGQEGIDIAHEFNPDIMLIDIGLPDMQGFDVAERLRAEPQFEKTVMVALTGYDCEERAKECGFNHYHKKPLSYAIMDGFLKAT